MNFHNNIAQKSLGVDTNCVHFGMVVVRLCLLEFGQFLPSVYILPIDPINVIITYLSQN